MSVSSISRSSDWFRLLVVACLFAGFTGAADDDLAIARNALNDKLYSVAVQHAESHLKRVQDHPAEGVDALRVLAQGLAEAREYDRLLVCLDTWRAVVEQAPDPGIFPFWRALALLNLNRPREALAVAEEAATRKTTPENADALQRLTARARLALGETTAALSTYAEVDKRSTNTETRAANLLEWASALEAGGRIRDAVGVLVRMVELNLTGPVTDQGRLAYGRLLARDGRRADAEAALRKLGGDAAASENNRVQAWVEVSRLLTDAGRTNDAVIAARKASELAVRPESRKLAAFQLADLLLAAPATLDEGVTRMKAFVRGFPDAAAAAQTRLAEGLLRNGRNEAAAAEYRVFLETFTDREREPAALEGFGLALFRSGHFSEAANILQKAHDRATNDTARAACLFHAADALHAAGQFRQAADIYRRVYTAYPSAPVAPQALFQTADSLERADDGDGAQAAFALAAQRCGKAELAVRALLRLGGLQAARSQTDAAIETFSQVLSATPDPAPRSEALMGRGRVHYRAYHFDAAGRDFAAVSETRPEWRDEADYLRTLCLYGLGRDEEARTAATAFVGTHTNSTYLSGMVLWLAKFDFNRNRLEEAGKRFMEYAARWPRGPGADAALLWAGRVAFRRADYKQTVELMSRLQREYPGSPRLAESRIVQGEALFEQARFDEAVLVFNEIVSRYADSDWVTAAWGRKGDALFALGTATSARYEEAVKAYREVLARRDATGETILQVEYKIGLCLEKMKQATAALDQYYSRVIMRYLADRQRGVWYSEAAGTWFVRAAFRAVDLLEQKNEFDQAERILNRVIQSNLPGHEEARQRIQRLRSPPGK